MTAGKAAKRGNQSITFHVHLNRDICAVSTKSGREAVRLLLDLVEAKHSKMNLVNLSTALHRLARVKMEDDSLPSFLEDRRMVLLHERVKQEVHASQSGGLMKDVSTNARCLSTIAWSCGRLQMEDSDLMRTIGDLAKTCLPAFKEFELTNLLWGFAKMQITHVQLFEAASTHVSDHLKEFTPSNLSMISWAFATARFRPCRKLLLLLGSTFADAVSTPAGLQSHAGPVVVENMIWALATAGVRSKSETLESIGNAACFTLANFKAHELAITLWAFARMEYWHARLFKEAAHLICRNAALRADLHTQAVTNILWAYAKQFIAQPERQRQPHMPLLSKLLPVLQRLLAHMKPMEISASLGSVLTLAMQWGMVPVADRFVVIVSELIMSLGGRGPLEFAQHSAVNILAAFTKFFASASTVPPVCNALMSQLTLPVEGPSKSLASAGEETAAWPMTQAELQSALPVAVVPLTCGTPIPGRSHAATEWEPAYVPRTSLFQSDTVDALLESCMPGQPMYLPVPGTETKSLGSKAGGFERGGSQTSTCASSDDGESNERFGGSARSLSP
mmetsp:Transcript_53544/g.125340  ORF Transcript_53544/g.125340 Transcript_53544/m.125340 type:complete len:563 (-) Transcript_53544:181-1869(-)